MARVIKFSPRNRRLRAGAAVPEVRAVPGKGLKGDRYLEQALFRRPPKSRIRSDLIEQENIDAFNWESSVPLHCDAGSPKLVTEEFA